MTISAAGSTAALLSQRLIDMRSQFDDLQRQLSTGQKSDTYAGLGLDRGLSVSLNALSAALGSYNTTIDNVMTRLNVAQNALTAVGKVSSNLGSALSQGADSPNNGNTTQVSAKSWLQQLVGLLNTKVGDRYVFSGSATDRPSTATYDQMINGDGAKAGLTQLISERNQADLGASGLGRLTVTNASATSVQIAEDSATSPFGFKLNAISSNLSNATMSGPSGSPSAETVSFAGVPSAGENVTFTFDLPDGTTSNLTLTATTDSPPGANQFTIGGTAAATATNLQTALTTALGTRANTTLKAASTVQASNEFFDGDSSNPPQRVNGPPYDTATSLVVGTSANTVIWYTGDTSGTARGSATARVDQSLTVNYGTRANETGIRNVVQSAATRAAVTVSSTDPNGPNFTSALDNRLSGHIDGSGGVQTVTDIEAELAGVQTSMQSIKANHQQTGNTLGAFLDQISGVSKVQVGTELLSLQTRMQASMQTTALLFQTSLVKYL
ncbi:MAG: flagellar biosynthesis protein FlgL [Pseudolabrys sp.]